MGIKKDRNHIELPVEFSSYEEVIVNFLWVIMLLLIVADVYFGYAIKYVVLDLNKILLQIILYIALVINCLFKQTQIRTERTKLNTLFISLKIIDIFLISFLLNTMRYGFLFHFIVLLPIISVCITKGFAASVPYLCVAAITQILSGYFVSAFSMTYEPLFDYYSISYILLLIILYFVYFITSRILGIYHNMSTQKELDNQKLVTQLGLKYAQLEEAKVDKQEQYDKLKEVNHQLEASNKRLTSSLAEFFTLQQISQAISSVFDMNELLQFVNDIIIGVMGVSTSNIALYDPVGDRLKVQVTNIHNIKDRAILADNINTPILKNASEEGRTIIDNDVDPDIYDFTKGRDVKSLMCVPLQVKGKTHGLVLIEHSIPEAFDEDNVRLLEIITQQVSIAIENAKLYEQLHEYANTDGLTQVYNRVFFQNRLKAELNQARRQNYEVSVILYDIDDFKEYNDTYGHLFGDLVLKSIAMMVMKSVRKDDIVARFGGEEFIILLPHTSKEMAFEKAEELRKKIMALPIHDQNDNIVESVSVSMGVSAFPTLAGSELELLNSADEALYLAKKKGKNCVMLAGNMG